MEVRPSKRPTPTNSSAAAGASPSAAAAAPGGYISNEQLMQNCLMSLLNVQHELETWTQRSRMEADVMHAHMSDSLNKLRALVVGGDASSRGTNRMAYPSTPPRPGIPGTPHRISASNTPSRKPLQQQPRASPLCQREEATLKQHDDDAWNDITSHISRELGGGTPPDTPDVTPMASPPCVERRPVSNLFGSGSAPINFELLFQQLSQEDPLPPRDANSDGDPWKHGANGKANKEDATDAKDTDSTSTDGIAAPPRPPSSNSLKPSISMETILQFNGQNVMKHLQVVYADHGRPTVVRVDGVAETVMPPPLDPTTPCQVLVEFKRRRVLQYDSPCYIVPGEYAIVAGDRGDDLGLVIFSWYNTPQGVTASGLSGASVGKWIGLGIGKVVRAANAVEVSQVHGIQSELERRAVEVCQQRAAEFALPMSILDAEYQFDR
eukprot:PhM_4_TR2420/c1_g1_i1/m.22214